MKILPLLHSNTPDALGAPNIIELNDNNAVVDRAPDWPSAPNVVEPDNGGHFTHRYNLRSQANFVLDTTTPPPVESSNLCSMANCVIDATTPLPVKNYNLRSEANCVLDATMPLPVKNANSVLEDVSGNLLEYRHLIKGPDVAIWTRSLANNFGRLA